MASVYIETTIPSFYFDDRADPRIALWRSLTRDWWNNRSARHSLCTSNSVLNEIRDTPSPKLARMLQLMEPIPVLSDHDEIRALAAACIRRKVMPRGERGDAAQVASATFHRVDVLLTWNIRHLANVSKQSHLSVVNKELGFATPIITTPELFGG